MSTAAQHLVSTLNHLPTSDLPPIEEQVDSTQEELDNTRCLVDDRIQQLEKQLAVWEQVASREKALESWLGSSVAGLQEAPQKMGDFDEVQAKLEQFQVRMIEGVCQVNLIHSHSLAII